MKKLLFIPRAINDMMSVWNKQLTFKEKSSLTYTLAILKLKKWLAKEDALIAFPLFEYKVYGFNNTGLQFLVKEIFIDKIYDIDKKLFKIRNLIDAGANIGLSVLFFKRQFPDAHIKAYEPNNTSFEVLKSNMEINRIKGVELFQAALAPCEADLYPADGFSVGSVNQTFSAAGTNGSKAVSGVRLTNLIKKETDCIKLDIEGAENEVLQDVIENDNLRTVPCWLVEFHDEKKQEMINAFEKNGFSVESKSGIYCFTLQKNRAING